MFKKMLVSVMMLCGLILGGVVINADLVSQAVYAGAQYLEGDRDRPLLRSHMGVSYYLDLTSVVVKRDDSTKIWAVNIVTVQDDTGDILKTDTNYYGFENGTAYVSSDGNRYSQINPFDDTGTVEVCSKGFRWSWRYAFGYAFS